MTRQEARNFIEDLVSLRGSLTDVQALEYQGIYPEWKEGVAVEVGERFRHGDKLYKVITAHTTQADWTPDISTSLFEVINITHAGTVDDPIPYDGNMALESGKYYSQDGITYLCTRDTGNAVYNALAELVGTYVETV